MSIIGDALQRAEREGAPLDAPKPAATPQRPTLDVAIVPPPKTATVSRPRIQPAASARTRRRVSPATVVLFVLAILTVYMLADPRWSGSNWGMDQLWIPTLSIDAPQSGAEAGPSPAMTASTLARDSAPAPVAALDSRGVELATPVPEVEQPAAIASHSDDTNRFVLSGVMLGGSTRLAVINGAIVEVGQMVDGAEVLAITRRDVTLSISGRRVRIAMQAEGVNRAEPNAVNQQPRPGPG